MSPQEWPEVPAMAELVGASREWIYSLIVRRKIEAVKRRGRSGKNTWHVNPASMAAYLRERGITPPGPLADSLAPPDRETIYALWDQALAYLGRRHCPLCLGTGAVDVDMCTLCTGYGTLPLDMR